MRKKIIVQCEIYISWLYFKNLFVTTVCRGDTIYKYVFMSLCKIQSLCSEHKCIFHRLILLGEMCTLALELFHVAKLSHQFIKKICYIELLINVYETDFKSSVRMRASEEAASLQ